MKLSEFVKNYRKEHNISMREFAKESNLSMAYVSFIENERNPKTGRPITPTIETLKKIALATHTDFDELFRIVDSTVSLTEGSPDESSSELSLEVGQKISDLRNKKKISQQKFADLVGISLQELVNMENGINRPFDINLMYQFSERLDVPITYFLKWHTVTQHIGKNIATLREMNGDSQLELANGLGIAKMEVMANESTESPLYGFISSVGEYYGVPSEWIISIDLSQFRSDNQWINSIRVLRMSKRWTDDGGLPLTKKETDEVLNYAKFVLSKRCQ